MLAEKSWRISAKFAKRLPKAPKFTAKQAGKLREGFRDGLKLQQNLTALETPNFTAKQAGELREGLRDGLKTAKKPKESER